MRVFKIGNWSWKKRVFSLLLLFGLYLVVHESSSVASNTTKNNVESSLPIPSYNLTFESLTTFYTHRNQSLPQVIFQRNWTGLPGNVSFSKYAMNTSDLQSSELYVYDVQWVPTQSCIIVVVSERGVPTVRPPDLGEGYLPISYFFPSVTVIALSNSNENADITLDGKCQDLHKNGSHQINYRNSFGIVSILYCPLENSFRERINSHNLFPFLFVSFRELDVIIPTNIYSASLEFGKLTRRNPPHYDKQKETISVCISGSTTANILHAREVVQYHLSSGMDHVYLGFTMDYNNLRDSSRGAKRMESMLQDYIQEGKVSVIYAPYTHSELELYYIDGYVKLPFLQSCLWHSKIYDKYIMVLDFDELLIVNDTSMTILESINTFIGSINDSKSTPNCYITVDDFSICPRSEGVSDRAMIGEAFPNREANTQRDVDGYNFYSEKSIALTQRVKYLGLHSHYHCHAELPLELEDYNNGGHWKSLSDYENEGTNARLLHQPELSQLNNSRLKINFFSLHFIHLRNMRDKDICKKNNSEVHFSKSEYTSIWFERIKNDLNERCLSITNENSTASSLLLNFCKKKL